MQTMCQLWLEPLGPMRVLDTRGVTQNGHAQLGERDGTVLPPAYHRLFWAWFACGFPAFAAVLVILWLMTSRPMFSFA